MNITTQLFKFIFAMKTKQKDSKIVYQFWKISTKITCPASALWCVLSLFGPIVSFTCTLHLWYNIGMARGIPRPSILEVPDFFSLLDSPRNKFYHSSAPQVLAKIRQGPRNTEYRTIFSNLSRFFCFPFCFSG